MKTNHFQNTLSKGFRVVELLSRYEIECRVCHMRWAVPKKAVRRPAFGIFTLLNHEYSHRRHRRHEDRAATNINTAFVNIGNKLVTYLAPGGRSKPTATGARTQ